MENITTNVLILIGIFILIFVANHILEMFLYAISNENGNGILINIQAFIIYCAMLPFYLIMECILYILYFFSNEPIIEAANKNKGVLNGKE